MERDAALKGVFEPVHLPTMFEETVERLGTAIRLGLLLPGSRLPSERSLANQLGISRSTLRLAITTLVQSGHLVSIARPQRAARSSRSARRWPSRTKSFWARRPGRCSTCASRPRWARRSWPPNGAGRSSSTGSTTSWRRCRRRENFEDYRRADIRFHIGVAEAARSPRLVRAMTEVQGQMSDLIALIAHPEQVLTHSNEQHRRLVALLRRGDGRRAGHLMREHIRGTEHIIAGLI